MDYSKTPTINANLYGGMLTLDSPGVNGDPKSFLMSHEGFGNCERPCCLALQELCPGPCTWCCYAPNVIWTYKDLKYEIRASPMGNTSFNPCRWLCCTCFDGGFQMYKKVGDQETYLGTTQKPGMDKYCFGLCNCESCGTCVWEYLSCYTITQPVSFYLRAPNSPYKTFVLKNRPRPCMLDPLPCIFGENCALWTVFLPFGWCGCCKLMGRGCFTGQSESLAEHGKASLRGEVLYNIRTPIFVEDKDEFSHKQVGMLTRSDLIMPSGCDMNDPVGTAQCAVMAVMCGVLSSSRKETMNIRVDIEPSVAAKMTEDDKALFALLAIANKPESAVSNRGSLFLLGQICCFTAPQLAILGYTLNTENENTTFDYTMMQQVFTAGPFNFGDAVHEGRWEDVAIVADGIKGAKKGIKAAKKMKEDAIEGAEKMQAEVSNAVNQAANRM